MDLSNAINVIESVAGFTDANTPVGEAWAVVMAQLKAAQVPVPVSERSKQIEDLAADAVVALRYIEQAHSRLYGVGWDRVYEKAESLSPAHALPLPAGEVE